MGILDSSRSACLLSVHNSDVISSFPRLTTSQLVVGDLTTPRKAVEFWWFRCFFLISKIDNATTCSWGAYQAEEVKGHLGEQPERQLQEKSWERYFFWLSINKHGKTKAMKQTSLWQCVCRGRSGWIKHCKKGEGWINACSRARVDCKALVKILSDKPSSNWGRCHQDGTKNYTECCQKVEVGISTATSWEETTTP